MNGAQYAVIGSLTIKLSGLAVLSLGFVLIGSIAMAALWLTGRTLAQLFTKEKLILRPPPHQAWQQVTVCVLCVLWFPVALVAMSYEPHWTYELEANTPLFPWSIAAPLAVARGFSIVLPLAATYFCFGLNQVSSDDRLGFYLRGLVYFLTALVDLAGLFGSLALPAITSALVR